ncbi:hypothetical protein [Nevskia ramosa]|uniref:hypothetical protein n=1 Tax=Nevskia ramosa TaxID=64002 RepID=UPI002357593C|nr:hypothetical protein [Nevskia ramosa]
MVAAMKAVEKALGKTTTNQLGHRFLIVEGKIVVAQKVTRAAPFKTGLAVPMERGDRVVISVEGRRLEVGLSSMGVLSWRWDEALGDIEMPDGPMPADLASARAWVRTGEHGASSLTMCMALFEIPELGIAPAPEYPRDPSDFRRCVAFLEAVPAARQRLDELRSLSGAWAQMVDQWDLLEATYNEEKGSEKAPELYDMLKKIAAGHRT